MKKIFSKLYFPLLGAVTGITNGLFGSGGGMLAVPMLENADIKAKAAHATAIAVTLPLSVISGLIYFSKGGIDILSALKYVPLGIVGAAIGAKLLKKLANKTIKKIFSIVMIAAGIRLFFK